MTPFVKRPLFVSPYPDSQGGYAVVAKEVLPALKAAGYEVANYAFWGGPTTPMVWGDGIPVYPPIAPGHHSDIVLVHADVHKADLVITMADPLAVPTAAYRKLFWVAWTPSDSEPVAPANVAALQHAQIVWSMSKHGHDQLKQAGFSPTYVPLSVNTDVFRPIPRGEARRAWLNLLREQGPNAHMTLDDDTYVIAFVGGNLSRPCRKGFWEALTAFKRFHAGHPNAVLYMHTDPLGAQGEPLDRWIGMTGVDPNRVWFPPSYHYMLGFIGQEWLAHMYSAADVMIQPSRGEGFGLPIVEAQACGCPVIVNDFSSMGELTFSGWKVTSDAWVPALNYGCLHRQISIDGLVAALEAAYEKRGDAQMRKQARIGALAYDTRTVYKQYLQPALDAAYEVYRRKTQIAVTASANGREQRPKWIIAAGMMRSGSTVHYQILLDLLTRAGRAVDGGFAERGEFAPIFARFQDEEKQVVVKAHKGNDIVQHLLETGEARAFYIERDLRDMLVSHTLRNWGDGVDRSLDDPTWMRNTVGSLTYWRRFWTQFPSTHVLDYGLLVTDLAGAVKELARALDVTISDADAQELAQQYTPEKMKAILPNKHVNDGRVGMWHDYVTDAQAAIMAEAIDAAEVRADRAVEA